jgi:ribosomal protein L7Ae-like RNA K-turn-binding protein
MSNEKIETLLQLAFKANKLVFGHDAVLRFFDKKKIEMIIVAEDLSRHSLNSIKRRTEGNLIEIITWGSKALYFRLFGKEIGIIGILDKHFKSGLKGHFSTIGAEA